ncbi:MAG: hypothetical protein KF710_11525 [Rhodocyclaceae bacterium]|nr:hypothetical protein [Rhodocyclaceae bacterium]MCP5308267.1 hypothetical protein [Zoogloeaceae bacterium]
MAIAGGASPAPAFPSLRNDTSTSLLRQLAVEPVAWSEIAELCAREPLISWRLLSSLPLDRKQLNRDLRSLLEERLAHLGAEVLRAWLLLDRGGKTEKRSTHHIGHSLLVAELAMHMAIEARYRSPQDAYLAGLWHKLATLQGRSPGPEAQELAQQAMLSARLAARAHPSPPVLDAIQLQGALEEHVEHSHTLVRLLWVALQLTRDDPQQRLETLSRIARLPESTLLALRADVAYLAEDAMQTSDAEDETSAVLDTTDLQGTSIDDPWVDAATRACIRAAFGSLGDSQAATRLAAASRLICARSGPKLILEQERNRLVPLLTGELDAQWLEGIELRLDDETSCLALALRTHMPSRYHATRNGPGLSTIDWELDRWLGGTGFVGLPWQSEGRRGVALFEPDHHDDDPRRDQLLIELVAAAVGEILRNRRLAAERLALQETALQRLNTHLRRVRHEVNNPLTIIRSHLDLLRLRYPSDQQLDNDLNVVGSEIERIGQMLKGLNKMDETSTEPGFCDANETLRTLGSICEDALFRAKGVHFELRTASRLPRVAILPSALNQVVLNLLKNASEALSPGNKVFVSTAGPLNVEGKSCVEMRIIDNGPGMPADRLKALFSDAGTDKGGSHEGIGLSIVRDILKQIGGYILCRSNPGAGTAIQLFIPVHN